MPFRANMNATLSLAVPGGYPLALAPSGETLIEFVVPKWVRTVTATAYAEAGTVDGHLALYDAPTTSGGADGNEVKRTDSLGITTETTTLSVAIPAGDAIAESWFLVRLWGDNFTGRAKDNRDRDPPVLSSTVFGVTDAVYTADPGAYNPKRRTRLYVASLTVA